MDTRGEEVRTVEPEMEPKVAVIVVEPLSIEVASPALSTVATPGFDVCQIT
jgi:hypothetical protein